MNTRIKIFESHNILQYVRDFIYVQLFGRVSKCQKMPKSRNVVITSRMRQTSKHVAIAMHICVHDTYNGNHGNLKKPKKIQEAHVVLAVR